MSFANSGSPPGHLPAARAVPVGGSKLLRATDHDQVTIVAAGVTVHEALKAAGRLSELLINARVIDLYSIKPVDRAALLEAAEMTGRIITVEDHWPEGGLGDAVLDAFTDGQRGGSPMPHITKLAVRDMPASATPDEQLHAAGIDADAIVAAARQAVEVI